MPKVKALRAHDNSYGETYQKEKGTVYEHPAPQSLIDNKLVELVDEKDDEGRGTAGANKSPAGTAEGDAAKHDKPGADKAG